MGPLDEIESTYREFADGSSLLSWPRRRPCRCCPNCGGYTDPYRDYRYPRWQVLPNQNTVWC